MGTAGGLSKKETLLSTPGEIGDLWELYLRAKGAKKEREPEDEYSRRGGPLRRRSLFMIGIVNNGNFSGGIPFSILEKQGYLISDGKFGDWDKQGVNEKIAVFGRKADHF